MESQWIEIIITCEYNKTISVCSSSYICMLQCVMRKSLPAKGVCSIVVCLIRLLFYFTYYSLNPSFKGTTCTTLLKEDVILQTTPLKKLNSNDEEKSYAESATQSEKEDTLQGDSTTKLV